MDDVIDAIRAAVAADATPDVKAGGIVACRAVLAALGASAGEPLTPRRPIDVGPTAQAIAAVIRTAPPEQLLDMVIAELRSAVPAESQAPVIHKFNVPLIRIPKP